MAWGRKKSNSKSKYLKFRGKAVYVMAYKPDEYNGAEFWKCGLAVTKDEEEKIKSAGIQLKKKFAENIPNIDDGSKFFTFKRPTEKKFGEETAFFCPPVIRDREGKDIVSYKLGNKTVYQYTDEDNQPEQDGESVLIGNGSDIEVTVCVYPAGSFGKGCRLEAIRIIDLIEYTPEDKEEVEPEDSESSEPEEKNELNDDIPFGKDKVQKVEKAKKVDTKIDTKVGW